jgi:hypothetical protein
MAIIPLSVAKRRLDTGNAAQYPQGSPIGGAMQGLGDAFSALVERHREIMRQQDGFDAELIRRKMIGQIAQAESDTTRNAPADGSGLHDAIYGELDPRTGRAVKPGLFDAIFDSALRTVPADEQPAFAAGKEALRAAGSHRVAVRQQQRRWDYEHSQVTTVLQTNASSIAQADPDDAVTFEAARQDGLDLIDKMGVDPGIRQQLVKDWFGATAKARFEALIAKDPKRALEMFGLAPPAAGSETTGNGAQAAGSSFAGSPKMAAGKGDRVGTQTPDERIAQAFQGDRGAQLNRLPTNALLADLSPDTANDLIQQAHAANAASLIDARTDIAIAAQNAPSAIANTGVYSGKIPGPETFTAVYGAEEGGKQYGNFARKIDVGRQAFGMRTMPNQAIHSALRDAEPGPAGSQEEQGRYLVTAAAALQTLDARRLDPAEYVRKAFPSVDEAWKAATNPGSKPETSDLEAYKWAIAISVAAQRQLGVEAPRPLPTAVVQSFIDTSSDKGVPQAEKTLRDLLAAAPDPGIRETLSQQLNRAGVSPSVQVDPIIAGATGQGQSPPLHSGESQSAFQQAANGFGNYLSEGFEALGRAPHDIGLALQDLRYSPWSFLEQLPVTPASGAVAEGRFALEAVGEAVAKGLAIVHSGAGKFAKPLEKFAANGSHATSKVAAERVLARQAVDTKPLVKAAEDAAYHLSTSAKPDKAELLKLIKSIARDPSKVKYPGASFGKAASKNYRKTFLDANPDLVGDVVVHHAAERQVLTRYLGLVAEDEMHSFQNLRGIPKGIDNLLHKTVFRFEWNKFYRSHPQPTRQQVLDYVAYIDKKYGHLFSPPIGE